MPKNPPVCSKCGKSHWNFTECVKVAEHRAARDRKDQNVAFGSRNVPEGYTPWGDRVNTLDVRGDNVHMLPPKKLQRGRFLVPPEAA